MTPPAQPTGSPRLLAFDTSTELLAIGLHDGAGSQGVHAAGGAAASAELLPSVHRLLARSGVTLAQLDAIAFGRGPGAFTGLRTACAVAQGLALGLKLPLLPLDSLLLVAEDARMQACEPVRFDVAVLMDARMGEIYAGRYCHVAGRWHTTLQPRLTDPLALAGLWGATGPEALAGSALTAFDLTGAVPAGAAEWPSERGRSTALLRLGLQALHDRAGVDAADALPLYLRDKVALTTAERVAAHGASARSGALSTP